jgi:hypothetical protein
MQLTAREAKNIMLKMEVELVQCKHHIRGFFCVNGRRLFPVHCSFGSDALPGNVPNLFRKSIHLSLEEFALFKDCKMSLGEYKDLLAKKGILR